MKFADDSFEISYCGVSVKVTPVEREGDTQFVVTLPTRVLTLEMDMDSAGNPFWQEVPGGRTSVADEIGASIEDMEM